MTGNEWHSDVQERHWHARTDFAMLMCLLFLVVSGKTSRDRQQ